MTRTNQSERLLDSIKDEIDKLDQIKSVKRRREAARDLVEYIKLHQLDGEA